MEDMKEFVAYLRRLKRDLDKLNELLERGDIETAKKELKELREDTQKDIESQQRRAGLPPLPCNKIIAHNKKIEKRYMYEKIK